MPTKTFTNDSTASGTLICRHLNFYTALTGNGTMEVRQNVQWFWAGQTFVAGSGYEIFGSLLVFDTSELPTNAVISEASLWIRINKVELVPVPPNSSKALYAWFQINNWTEPISAGDWQTWNAIPSNSASVMFDWAGQWDQNLTIQLPSSTYGSINLGAGARTGLVIGYRVNDPYIAETDAPNFLRFAHEAALTQPDDVESRLIVTYTLTTVDPTALYLDLVTEGRLEAIVLSGQGGRTLNAPLQVDAFLMAEVTYSSASLTLNVAVLVDAYLTASVTQAGTTTLLANLYTAGVLDVSPTPQGPGNQTGSGTSEVCACGTVFLDTGVAIDYLVPTMGGAGTLTLAGFGENIPLWDGELVMSGVGVMTLTLTVLGYEEISAGMLLEVEGSGWFIV